MICNPIIVRLIPLVPDEKLYGLKFIGLMLVGYELCEVIWALDFPSTFRLLKQPVYLDNSSQKKVITLAIPI